MREFPDKTKEVIRHKKDRAGPSLPKNFEPNSLSSSASNKTRELTTHSSRLQVRRTVTHASSMTSETSIAAYEASTATGYPLSSSATALLSNIPASTSTNWRMSASTCQSTQPTCTRLVRRVLMKIHPSPHTSSIGASIQPSATHVEGPRR